MCLCGMQIFLHHIFYKIYKLNFQLSISQHPLTELSNPGASGSLFFVTHDDKYIIKTVQHKEAEFLQKLLPGYYMVIIIISRLCFIFSLIIFFKV